MEYKIVLASGSPRRREIMDLVGAEYIVIPSDKEEDMSGHEPARLVEKLSKMKAEDVASKIKGRIDIGSLSKDYLNSVVIGCDTVVAYEGKILGKPHDEQQAFDMIRDFAGRSHHVFTGVCLIVIEDGRIAQTVNYSVSTAVNVSPMTDDEIHAYVATGETLDKAGAYAIQGRFCPYIESIEGDYYNIVGYPVSSIYRELKKLGIDLF
ncbi:MAG: septum formation protein Maf [Lachnospiraceae bacterium]|nr:septum formation protein Maf [Lachnospiraceae bacterium]MBP5652968.1 septum formation protein Maf [Lachnospiraceae bacterium]